MVVSDDLGWAEVPWHNNVFQEYLPTLQALATQGVILERHYGYAICAPSRAALMSGRLPLHVQQYIFNDNCPNASVPLQMTLLPQRLHQRGYATHGAGKWHLGFATPSHLPISRGFDSFFGYFAGCENEDFTDLWLDDGPAIGRACEDEEFAGSLVQKVRAHPLQKPLFLYLATRRPHLGEAGPALTAKYLQGMPSGVDQDQAAKVKEVDFAVLNITAALKARGMWDHTLLIFTADHGQLDPYSPFGSGDFNAPLRGAKGSAWDGGTRLASFVSGGFLPASQRGTGRWGLMHLADWYATLIRLVGGADDDDPPDGDGGAAAAATASDSLDMWPLLSGANLTSPRAEVPLIILPEKSDIVFGGSALNGLISGDLKLVKGLWPDQECPRGCLFNITQDPYEAVDISLQLPQAADKMKARMAELLDEMTSPLECENDDWAPRIWENVWGGYLGPWRDLQDLP